jgi:2-iminobutanoate/2-iminopropanoate deaminase
VSRSSSEPRAESERVSSLRFEAVEPPFEWARDLDFSQALIVSGPLVWVSGQAALDNEGAVVPGGLEAQIRQAYSNLGRVLSGAGASFGSVIKTTAYFLDSDEATLATWRKVRGEFFSAPPFPTLAAFAVSGFFYEGMLVEIEAVASLNAPTGSGGRE